MKTAVEWLYEQLPTIDKYDPYYADIITQAKEMEKEQIIDAYQQAEKDNGKDFLNGDLYYNEIFKSGKQSYQDKMRDKITKAKSRMI